MKRAHPHPTAEQLWALIRFDGEHLYWLPRPRSYFKNERNWKTWTEKSEGQMVSLSRCGSGYFQFRCRDTLLLAHRVIWALVHGEWPVGELDHINGDITDNRIENLRVCDRSAQMRNQKLNTRNTSGQLGVSWLRREKRWSAKIHADGRAIRLGYFQTKEEAIACRRQAESLFGYHENHGRSINQNEQRLQAVSHGAGPP